MVPFDFRSRTHMYFGAGAIDQLGAAATALGSRHVLLVADAGILQAGHARTGQRRLEAEGIRVSVFSGFGANPDSAMAEAGRAFAASLGIDVIVGLGGGSSLDCAKAINFLLTNGGVMADYKGYGKARTPLLPMIAVPTTAGTGSEAQSYAVIADAGTHMKMACGDPSAACRVAILDPELTLSTPRGVTAAAGFDAIAHAVETAVTTRRTAMSEAFAHQAWRLLSSAYEHVLREPGDLEARSSMQVGACLAGMAIEQSMLGAAHACANPLTARYDLAHGAALAITLPQVVRWNADYAGEGYATLFALDGRGARSGDAEALARTLESWARAGGLPTRLAEVGVDAGALPELAALAASQWTGGFNPRPFHAEGALEIYRAAL